MKKQIFINIFSTYIGRGIGMALGFFLVPFLIVKLGLEVFGLIVLFESLMRFVEMFSTSIRVALSRYATFSLAQGDSEEFSQYLSTGRGIFFVLSAVVLVGGLAFSRLVPAIFSVPDAYHSQSVILFSIMTVAFAITIPNIVFWSVLFAKQRFDLINISDSAGLVLRAVVIFIAFSVLPEKYVSLPTYGVVYLAMTWAQNFFVFFWSKKIVPDLKIRLSLFRWNKVRSMVSFSFFTLLGHSNAILYDNTVNILINILWGPASNAIYAIGIKCAALMDRLFKEPAWTLAPTFTELAAKGENEKLKELYFVYTKALSLICIPICIFLMIYAGPVIRLWIGSGYELSSRIMVLSLIATLFSVPLAASGNLATAYAKLKWPTIVDTVSTALCVGVGYLLAKPLGMGLTGFVLATSAIKVMYYGFFNVTYACHLSKIPLWQFWKEAFLKTFFWSLLVWGGGLMALRQLHQGRQDLPDFILLVSLLGALYAAVCYVWVFSPKDKNYLERLIRAVTSRLGFSVIRQTHEF